MRIGIWCDYGRTIAPRDGIGVFVDNLVRGILAADSTCRIALKAHPGETRTLGSLEEAGGERVKVVAESASRRHPGLALRRARKLQRHLGPPPHGPLAAGCHRLLTRLADRLDSGAVQARQRIIDECDVWLLPYVGTDQPFTRPTVVVVHDLVNYHFPGMATARDLRAFKHVVKLRTESACTVACMSRFIHDHDLVGTLGLPACKLKVVQAAVPADLGMGSGDQSSSAEAGIQSPYLLFPAGFRPYKNHEMLLEALVLLRRRDRSDWRVVFTGEGTSSAEFMRLLARYGVQDSVSALGIVPRQRLAALYRAAFATVVPSRYEQGSFPLMEALHCGCPAIASDIPALREQFAVMGQAMLYVNPDDPASLLATLDQIGTARQQLIALQQSAFAAMARYTWTDAARQWLAILADAVGQSRATLPSCSGT